ncbi:hypothetical protein [Nocardia wallacei]|uniref:hypothetical protein n=1 Tax=Nocardia wallacei TaxID=480035 RepID=UPI003CC7FDE0
MPQNGQSSRPGPEGGSGFGAQPLAQTVAAAAAIRRLTGLLLSLERPHAAVDDLLARLPDWEAALAGGGAGGGLGPGGGRGGAGEAGVLGGPRPPRRG